jgi:5-methylcytosine-specific restriction enzyme subunit McrC
MPMPVDGRLLVDADAIPVRNAWYLLLYAWDLARWKGSWDSAAETSPNLLGLLARVLVECTSDLLRRQLARSHHTCIREIAGIRGRIDFPASLKRLTFNSGAAVCVFPELTVDTLRNRLIRATLEGLFRDERVAIGATPQHVQRLRHDIKNTLDRMHSVSPMRLHPSDFTRVRLGRNDDTYQLPLAVCRLIISSQMPTQDRGDVIISALVRDEIQFSDVFERFVRNFLRHALPQANITSEHLSWPDEIGSSLVPRMRTDVSIDWTDPEGPARRLVIDTKYYAKTLSGRYDNVEKFRSSHLYQLYAYLRTQEHRGERYKDCPGILLYPTTGASVDERMRVQGHEMRIMTIDLARPWQDIERDLLAMVGVNRD